MRRAQTAAELVEVWTPTGTCTSMTVSRWTCSMCKIASGKVAILHMVDTATRFSAARVLLQEQGTDVVRALQRAWFVPYGPPKLLQFDEARCFCGDEVKTYLEQNNVQVDVAPGEAHSRLGIVERRHLVLRTAIETYMADEQLSRTLSSVREAVMHVTPAMNQLSFVKGYTPSQWVLNTNPKDASSLLADEFNPSVHHDALHDRTFEEELKRTKCRTGRLLEGRRGRAPPASVVAPPSGRSASPWS